MLVQTIVYFAPKAILQLTQLVNEQVFGTIEIGPDTTQVLEPTIITNNNAFGFLEVALGEPQPLAPTLFANTNSFGALTIGAPPDPGFIEGALLINPDEELLINPDEYLQIEEP